MPSSVGRPDELMDLESASPSDDSEDEDNDHVLDIVEAGLAEVARPPKSTNARNNKRIVYIHIDIEHGGPKCGHSIHAWCWQVWPEHERLQYKSEKQSLVSTDWLLLYQCDTVTKGIVKQSKSNRELMRREGGLEGTGKADPWEMYTTKMMGWCTWLVHLGFGLISIWIVLRLIIVV